MDDRKMDSLITDIRDPVFVGTAGLADQFFDHIEVRVELNNVDGKVNLPPHGKQFFLRTVRTFFSAR